jgi:hypothetical protein
MVSDALEARKAALEDRIEALGSWMIGFIWPVAIGLFIEFYAVLQLDLTKDWNALIDRIGLLLVTAGVAGELVIEHKTHTSERRLRAVDTEIERELDAELKAAEERIAELKLTTEQERLARIEIEKQMTDLVSPRRLKPEDVAFFRELLTPHIGIRVDVFVFDGFIIEVALFAKQLTELFVSSGLKPLVWYCDGPRMSGPGLHLEVASELFVEQGIITTLQNTMGLLASRFQRIGIDCVILGRGFDRAFNPPLADVSGHAAWDPADVAFLRVQVGAKQVPLRNQL